MKQNWELYLLLVASTITGCIAIIFYAKTRVSSEEHEIRIRRIEGILNSKFEHAIKGKETSIFQVAFALEGILFNIEDLIEEVKEWHREDNDQRKKIIEGRCEYDWESVREYNKILEDHNIVSDKVFEKDVLEMIKKISEQCKINLEFNYSKNQSRHEGIHTMILNSLLILEKFDFNTQYHDLL